MKGSNWNLYKELSKLSKSETIYAKEYGLPIIQFDITGEYLVDTKCTLDWIWQIQYLLYMFIYNRNEHDIQFNNTDSDSDGLFQYSERESLRLTGIIYRNKGLRTSVASLFYLLGYEYLADNPQIIMDLLVRPFDY